MNIGPIFLQATYVLHILVINGIFQMDKSGEKELGLTPETPRVRTFLTVFSLVLEAIALSNISVLKCPAEMGRRRDHIHSRTGGRKCMPINTIGAVCNGSSFSL